MEDNYTLSRRIDTLRRARNLSITELASLARVSQPLISNLIHGRATVGERIANRIGAALQLRGGELDDFVYLAINGCKEKVLSSSKLYPAELLNLIAGELRSLGILPEKIASCVRRPAESVATLRLSDGKLASINIEVAIR